MFQAGSSVVKGRSYRVASWLPITRLRRGIAIGLAGAVLAFGMLESRTTSACSTRAPVPALRGYPSEGATEVPTDVVPFFASESSLRLTDAEFTLTAADGEVTQARVARAQVSIVELTFEKALQPNTAYTLAAKLNGPMGPYFVESLSLSFTTGAGPLTEVPPPPLAFLQKYRFTHAVSSCEPGAESTCVAITSGLPVEATPTTEAGEDGQDTYLQSASWFGGMDLGCTRLRTRAPNGTYSAPVVLCLGDDVPLFTISGSERLTCTPEGITHDGVLLTSSAVGSGGAPGESNSSAGNAGASSEDSEEVAEAGAFNGPLRVGAGCSMAVHSKHSTSWSNGALFALALFVGFRRRVRARARSLVLGFC
jgi:hypothetical protein